MAVLGAYLKDSNVSNTSGYSAGTIGGYAGYGLNDKTDLYLTLGLSDRQRPASRYTASQTAIGLSAKYLIAAESARCQFLSRLVLVTSHSPEK